MTEPILQDERDIDAVYYNRGGGYEVGEDGITRIEAYGEKGQMARVPWIAVYKNGELYRRIPAQWVTVHYEVEDVVEEDFEPDDELPF